MFHVYSYPGFRKFVTDNFGKYDVPQSEWGAKDMEKAKGFFSLDEADTFRRYACEETGFQYYVYRKSEWE